MFFYYQLLVGDSTDNIKGLYKIGPVKAYKLLYEAQNEDQLLAIVRGMYEEFYAENATERLLENARLLWMVNELNEQGEPTMWDIPK
jgi:5'-3' exonuclease